MTAEAIIDELRKLPHDELNKVGKFLGIDDLHADFEADRVAAQRDLEMERGQVIPLTHEEVFRSAREKLR